MIFAALYLRQRGWPTYRILGVAALAAAAYQFFRQTRRRAGLRRLKGRVAVVTGATGSIGRLVCHKLAKAGAHVAVWDLERHACADLAAELSDSHGVVAFGVPCDLRQQCAVEAAVLATRQQAKGLGGVAVLVNNAGFVSAGSSLETTPVARMEVTVAVNLTAHLRITQLLMPDLKAQCSAGKSAHVVGVASAAGLVGLAGLSDYCAAKHGAVGFAEALRVEARVQGFKSLHVASVCPSFVGDSELFKGKTFALTPALTVDGVATEVVGAIADNTNGVVALPFMVPVGRVLNCVLPTWLYDCIVIPCAARSGILQSARADELMTTMQSGAAK